MIVSASTSKFVLLAIPFFILAGNIMEKAGISEKLIKLAEACVGHIRGGLAIVCAVSYTHLGEEMMKARMKEIWRRSKVVIIAVGMVICMTAAFFFGAAWSRNVAERNVVKAANSEAEKEMQDEQEIAESAWGISEDSLYKDCLLYTSYGIAS